MDQYFAKKLKERRILLGLSQKQLAQTLGIRSQQIQNYEYGLSRITASTLYRLSKALHVSPDYFFTNANHAATQDYISDPHLLPLLRYFWSIPNVRCREGILVVFKSLSEKEEFHREQEKELSFPAE
ncbi:hypothetical protein JCM17844_30000 [Iodidimonas gelatinilytica]|uniref:HTH cro/C1-type domain-containing protein n=1 Tax=Iodidimonas gelatinilytica TaxID=1236966 RepID=A0A5A7MVJ0_9PROT|nr:helix-turn-helix transcriptional regulator [Iodidimonas gelatinilytica]GEQ99363.1 hypothetical protein JCM17844_30000 [Iodidimonas gelatinilytica]